VWAKDNEHLGGQLSREAVVLEDVSRGGDVVMSHADNGGLVARVGSEEPIGNSADGVGVDLVDLVCHFCDGNLAAVDEDLEGFEWEVEIGKYGTYLTTEVLHFD